MSKKLSDYYLSDMKLPSQEAVKDASRVKFYHEDTKPKTYTSKKPVAELTAVPANKRPLEWQRQTFSDNYGSIHDKVKAAWDKYLISPEDVKDANDYYENELVYENFPGAVPLAALGSTLTGDVYDMWRDFQTDPANLIGGELLRGGKKASELLGAIKFGSKPRQ